MHCDRCGLTARVLKTCRWRDRNGGPFTLCDECWLPISGSVWIVPGSIAVFGKCQRCGSWESARDLVGARPGGRRGDWIGTCRACENGAG